MYIYIYIYIYIHISLCVIYIHTYIYICMIYIYTYTYFWIYLTCVYIDRYAYIHNTKLIWCSYLGVWNAGTLSLVWNETAKLMMMINHQVWWALFSDATTGRDVNIPRLQLLAECGKPNSHHPPALMIEYASLTGIK